MAHMSDSPPWLLRFITLSIQPEPRPPPLNACYLQVITPISKRRELTVFDGQYTALAVLSKAAAKTLDEDEEGFGVTTRNLCGHLIAVVKVLVVPSIGSGIVAPSAVLSLRDVRVFPDRFGGLPSESVERVDRAEGVLSSLRAWIGGKMAEWVDVDNFAGDGNQKITVTPKDGAVAENIKVDPVAPSPVDKGKTDAGAAADEVAEEEQLTQAVNDDADFEIEFSSAQKDDGDDDILPQTQHIACEEENDDEGGPVTEQEVQTERTDTEADLNTQEKRIRKLDGMVDEYWEANQNAGVENNVSKNNQKVDDQDRAKHGLNATWRAAEKGKSLKCLEASVVQDSSIMDNQMGNTLPAAEAMITNVEAEKKNLAGNSIVQREEGKKDDGGGEGAEINVMTQAIVDKEEDKDKEAGDEGADAKKDVTMKDVVGKDAVGKNPNGKEGDGNMNDGKEDGGKVGDVKKGDGDKNKEGDTGKGNVQNGTQRASEADVGGEEVTQPKAVQPVVSDAMDMETEPPEEDTGEANVDKGEKEVGGGEDEIQPVVKEGLKRKGEATQEERKKKVWIKETGGAVDLAVMKKVDLEMDLLRKYREGVNNDTEKYIFRMYDFLPGLSNGGRKDSVATEFPQPEQVDSVKEMDENRVTNVPDSAPI